MPIEVTLTPKQDHIIIQAQLLHVTFMLHLFKGLKWVLVLLYNTFILDLALYLNSINSTWSLFFQHYSFKSDLGSFPHLFRPLNSLNVWTQHISVSSGIEITDKIYGNSFILNHFDLIVCTYCIIKYTSRNGFQFTLFWMCIEVNSHWKQSSFLRIDRWNDNYAHTMLTHFSSYFYTTSVLSSSKSSWVSCCQSIFYKPSHTLNRN